MRKSGQGYRKLLAFQAAHELVRATYKVTTGFPKTERFGLVSQMQRAAVSVAANIVEGHALNSTALFIRHLSISFGSCKELEYYIELSGELGYIKEPDIDQIQQLEGRAAYLINSLVKALKTKMAASKKVGSTTIITSPGSLDSFDSSDSCSTS